jgi:hypothetical protein
MIERRANKWPVWAGIILTAIAMIIAGVVATQNIKTMALLNTKSTTELAVTMKFLSGHLEEVEKELYSARQDIAILQLIIERLENVPK